MLAKDLLLLIHIMGLTTRDMQDASNTSIIRIGLGSAFLYNSSQYPKLIR